MQAILTSLEAVPLWGDQHSPCTLSLCVSFFVYVCECVLLPSQTPIICLDVLIVLTHVWHWLQSESVSPAPPFIRLCQPLAIMKEWLKGKVEENTAMWQHAITHVAKKGGKL